MTAKPQPPQALGRDARRFWRAVLTEYELSAPELLLLEQAAEAYGHACAAWQTLATDGATVADRYGSPKQHPAVATANTMAQLVARLARQLGLELVDDDVVKLKGRGPGRPSTTRARKAA